MRPAVDSHAVHEMAVRSEASFSTFRPPSQWLLSESLATRVSREAEVGGVTGSNTGMGTGLSSILGGLG